MSFTLAHNIHVNDWPLHRVGDEQFFGYVVAVGVLPGDWSEDNMIVYADFAYGDAYARYRLPNDEELKEQLLSYLKSNVQIEHGIYGKVWIKLTPAGYSVELP